jgi:hypothetical protein
MSTTNQAILEAIETYKLENEKFEGKGIAASAARARAALGDLAKLAKVRRLEIQTKKNELKEAKASK